MEEKNHLFFRTTKMKLEHEKTLVKNVKNGPEITITFKNFNLSALTPEGMIKLLKQVVLNSELSKPSESNTDNTFLMTHQFSEILDPAIIVSSTFFAKPLLSSLNPLLARFSDAKASTTYNDFFSQLTQPSSGFYKNKRGLNILLIRFYDLAKNPENLKTFKSNLEKLSNSLRDYKGQVPLLLACCPDPVNNILDSEIKEKRAKIRDDFLKGIYQEKLAHLLLEQEFQTYSSSDPHDQYTDKEAHMPYNIEYYNAIGHVLAKKYYNFSTPPKKVIVLDCDNTLWKGIVAEDGLDGIQLDPGRKFLQNFLIEKSHSGFLICLCSKNNESDVMDVFNKFEMPLKKEHLTAYRINWKPKSENIHSLATELGLDMDSFIFIDDEPTECAEVQKNCPNVLTLELPKDHRLIPVFIKYIWSLESFSEGDSKKIQRVEHYKNNVKRVKLKEKSNTFSDYLKELELKTNVRSAGPGDYSRIVNLMRRSSQFNFNKWATDECSENNLKHLIIECNYTCLAIDVEDRYNKYGLVGVILYVIEENQLVIKGFVLSCRALGKGVEYDMLKELGKKAKSHGNKNIYIEFQETQRNKPVSEFIKKQGFIKQKRNEKYRLYILPVEKALSAGPCPLEEEITDAVEPDFEIKKSIKKTKSYIVKQNSFLKNMLEKAILSEKEILSERDRKEKISGSGKISKQNMLGDIDRLCKKLSLYFDEDSKEQSFLNIGLDSIKAVQLTGEIYNHFGIEIQFFELLKPNCTRKILIDKILEKQVFPNATSFMRCSNLISNERQSVISPLSQEQLRLWWAYQEDKKSNKYNMSLVYKLTGIIDLELFRTVFQQVVKQETVFRTKFYGGIQNPKQEIRSWKENQWVLGVQNEEASTLDECYTKIRHFIAAPFDLEEDFLLRVNLLRLSEKAYYLVICIPHIIHDATSLVFLINKINVCYQNSLIDKNKELNQFESYQYIDYVKWQQGSQFSRKLEKNKEYWRQQLKGAQPINLPFINKNKTVNSRSDRYCFSLPSNLIDQMNKLRCRHQVNYYHILLSVFMVLLRKYSGQENIMVVSPTSGRQHIETKNMLGFFVNLLFIRHSFHEHINFFELLDAVRNTVIDGLEHQDVPFKDILELLGGSYRAVQPIGFSYQNYESPILSLKDISCEMMPQFGNNLLYDMATQTRLGLLSIMFRQEKEKISGLVEYNTGSFSSDDIEKLIHHFKILFKKILDCPAKPILNHSLLSQNEEKKLLRNFNHTSPSVKQKCQDLVTVFMNQVKATPEALAIHTEHQELTYNQLNIKSNQLSAYLEKKLSLNREDRIAICLPRDSYEAIAILAILKSGCAYVPINERDPLERINHMLSDTQAKALLILSSMKDKFSTLGVEKINLDDKSSYLSSGSEISISTRRPNQLAYIMYTSGSTGTPKGVMVEDRSVVGLVVSNNEFKLTEKDRIPQISNPSFDAVTFEFWGALLNGGTLIYPKEDILFDLHAFKKFLSENTISCLWLTAALFEKFAFLDPRLFDGIKILSGGDVLNPNAVRKVLYEGKPAALFNGYGPTENTTFSTVHHVTLKDTFKAIPIGKPIIGTEVYVLDDQKNLVPPYIPGYLYLGGEESLARGYLNQPDLTHEKFLTLNFFGKNKRLYNTGDLVYWTSDGVLHYVGRKDNMIKRNGYRIDLNEIEFRLLQHSDIEQVAVVTTHPERGASKLLVAYYVCKNIYNKFEKKMLDSQQLQDYLLQFLPYYMMPDRLIERDNLPITKNGKIDRAFLISQICSQQLTPVFNQLNQLKTLTEHKLSKLVKEILGWSSKAFLKSSDVLFELGLHSIEQIELSFKVRDQFGVQLSVNDISQGSTIKTIASIIDQKICQKSLPTKNSKFIAVNVKVVQPGYPEKPPLVFIHPAGGSTKIYNDLIQYIDHAQPIYVIEDPSLTSGQIYFNDVTEMAACYLKAIRQKKPSWPGIILIGWSFGGIVSLEMSLQAEQYSDKNFRIQSVILLDTWLVSQAKYNDREQLKSKVLKQCKLEEEGEINIHINKLFERRQGQGFSYQPKTSISTPVFLCKAKEAGELINIRDNKNLLGNYVKTLTLCSINGNHSTLLDLKYAEQLSNVVQKCASSPLNFSIKNRSVFFKAKKEKKETLLNQGGLLEVGSGVNALVKQN